MGAISLVRRYNDESSCEAFGTVATLEGDQQWGMSDVSTGEVHTSEWASTWPQCQSRSPPQRGTSELHQC